MANEEPDEAASTPSHISESRWQARCAVLSLLATFLLHSPQVDPSSHLHMETGSQALQSPSGVLASRASDAGMCSCHWRHLCWILHSQLQSHTCLQLADKA